jgi:hypothetical protein
MIMAIPNTRTAIRFFLVPIMLLKDLALIFISGWNGKNFEVAEKQGWLNHPLTWRNVSIMD